MTLAVLPRQRERTPSCWDVRRKHSTIPLYLRSRRPVLSISSCATNVVSGDDRRISGTQTKTYLVLDEKLDTLDGSSGGLRDGSGDTTHYR